MPELPELETICRQFRKLLGFSHPQPQESTTDFILRSLRENLDPHPIASLSTPTVMVKQVEVLLNKLRYPLPEKFLRWQPVQLLDIRRRSRYLLFHLDGQQTLILHLGMTGQLIFIDNKTVYQPQKHDIFYLHLEEPQMIVYRDIRRFGFAHLCPTIELPHNRFICRLGPEPLTEEFNAHYLQQLALKTSKPVKNLIMDNAVVVGVGNIYANESLFKSHILPQRPSKLLTMDECQSLAENIRQTLIQSILANGTTFSDYRDGYGNKGGFLEQLQVYGKVGQLCPRCGQANLEKIVLGGRSSFFCPHCQK